MRCHCLHSHARPSLVSFKLHLYALMAHKHIDHVSVDSATRGKILVLIGTHPRALLAKENQILAKTDITKSVPSPRTTYRNAAKISPDPFSRPATPSKLPGLKSTASPEVSITTPTWLSMLLNFLQCLIERITDTRGWGPCIDQNRCFIFRNICQH